jgi:hypothetical protein
MTLELLNRLSEKVSSSALLFLLLGCHSTGIPCLCPEPVIYSRDMQKSIVDDLEKSGSKNLEKVIVDFYILNQKLRICHNFQK